ncbi:MAG: AEC family transporter [Candidatus Syntrophosphaera sp.]|nr:AEC family transporter [Candidatus Syntrophosphaera sp.]
MNLLNSQNLFLILSFGLGLGLKQLKLMSREDASVLLRLVLNICLPPIMILAIYRATPSADMLLVTLSAMLVVGVLFLVSSFIGHHLNMPRPTFGSFLVGTMIMNTAFALPYFKAIGSEELARASLFDIGNTILIFTFSYYNAIKFGDNRHTDKIRLSRFLTLPPVWGLLAAFAIKALRLEIPAPAISFLEILGQPIGLLMMVALGLAFAPQKSHLGKALIAVFIRMGLGLAVGFLLSLAFGLQGIPRTVVIVCSSLPVGFNTLILANRENMDREFAATMVSLSTLLALFTIPLLIHILA